jgi:hypothetical protein
MTKTLTEQWREGTLPDGKYYIKLEPNFTERYDVGYSEGGDFVLYNIEDIEEVLAPVPSYEEYQDILQQNVNQESAIETYIEEIIRLQEQLNEANALIRKIYGRVKYFKGESDNDVENYIEKYWRE